MKKSQNVLLITLSLILLSQASVVGISSRRSTATSSLTAEIPQSSEDAWVNVTLPEGPIPDANITLQRGTTTLQFSLTEIINYTTYTNQTFPMVNHSITIDEQTHNVTGFNPFYLMELAEWTDVMNFTLEARDGYTKIANITQLLLSDGNFVKTTQTDFPTILIIAWNKQWVADYDVEYGDFYFWGQNLANNQKVKNVSQLTYTDPWKMQLTVNGQELSYYDSTNATSIGNYTSYSWGYEDDTGYGFKEQECTGFTVASLIATTNITWENYTVSFVAYDGYGADKVFTKDQIENGYTGEMINDPPIPLDNQGKQAIIMSQEDGKDLGYDRGPYRLIIPGASRSSYIGGLVEIRITIVPTAEVDPKIPGYPLMMFSFVTLGIIFALSRKFQR